MQPWYDDCPEYFVFTELRLQFKGKDEHFSAQSFELHHFSEVEIRLSFINFLAKNHITFIYIHTTRPKGPFYGAVLENYPSAESIRKASQLSPGTSSQDYHSEFNLKIKLNSILV